MIASSYHGNFLMTALNQTSKVILSSCLSGRRISKDEALLIWKEATYPELAVVAHEIRLRQNPPTVATYLIDRNINYTNVCNSDCSFCAFYRHDSTHPESYVLSHSILKSKVDEAVALGACRLLLQGGHNDDLPYSFHQEMISWIHETYPPLTS